MLIKKKMNLIKKMLKLKINLKKLQNLVKIKHLKLFKESKENGELYGSIKPKEITNLIKEKTKADVSPSQIILKEDLNKIGVF